MITFNNIPILQLAYDKSLDDPSDDLVQKEHLLRNKLIWKVASTCFAELIVGSLVTGTACCFMATTAIPTAVTLLITIVAITTLFHSVEALIDYHLSCHILREGDLKNTNFLTTLQLECLLILRHLRPYLFAVVDEATHGTLIHEVGHALTSWLLYENANPQITLLGDGRGFTSFNEQVLSKWGQQLGTKRALLVTVAAGAAFAIFEASLLLTVAHVIKDKHPELHRHLVYIAIRRVVTHVFYALSALPLALSEAEGHDFHILWKIGKIHPVAAAATIIAIPIFVQYALWKWTKASQVELEE